MWTLFVNGLLGWLVYKRGKMPIFAHFPYSLSASLPFSIHKCFCRRHRRHKSAAQQTPSLSRSHNPPNRVVIRHFSHCSRRRKFRPRFERDQEPRSPRLGHKYCMADGEKVRPTVCPILEKESSVRAEKRQSNRDISCLN